MKSETVVLLGAFGFAAYRIKTVGPMIKGESFGDYLGRLVSNRKTADIVAAVKRVNGTAPPENFTAFGSLAVGDNVDVGAALQYAWRDYKPEF